MSEEGKYEKILQKNKNDFAADFTIEFNCANPSKEVAAPVRLETETWCRPPPGMSKLNVDAGCLNLMMAIWALVYGC